jgi:hypothetical protein
MSSMAVNKCDWCLVRSETVVRVYFEKNGHIVSSFVESELIYWLCERCRGDLKRLKKSRETNL